jgi:multidrug resistance efflux pump
VKGAATLEDLRATELTWFKYRYEEETKKANQVVAEAELHVAKANVGMHEIRSPLRGTIRTIHLRPGEAVKNFEPVVRIRVEE